MVWTLILMLAGTPGGTPAMATIQGLSSVEDCIRIASSWSRGRPERSYSCVANNLPPQS